MAGLLTVLLAVEDEHALAQEGVNGALRILVRFDVTHRHIQGDALVDRLQPENQVQRKVNCLFLQQTNLQRESNIK